MVHLIYLFILEHLYNMVQLHSLWTFSWYDDCIHTEGKSTFQNEWLIFSTSHHLLALAEENHKCSCSAG